MFFTDYCLTLGAGLLGSAHCVGMCGPLVVWLGNSAGSSREFWRRQAVYAVGRLGTYVTLGALAAESGVLLQRQWGATQPLLALIAGMLLLGQGLLTVLAWAIRWPNRVSQAGCQLAGAFRSLLADRSMAAVFLAGVVNGLLPCGLLYGFVALAASRGEMTSGAATMLAFGLGTLPALWLTAWGVQRLPAGVRVFIWRTAGVCLIVLGGLTLWRGVAGLSTHTAAACPFCQSPPANSSAAATTSAR